jgi:hypothetical protein
MAISFMIGMRSAIPDSSAEYLPVRNVIRTDHLHDAHGHDARAGTCSQAWIANRVIVAVEGHSGGGSRGLQ